MSTSKHTLELSSTQATECNIQFVSCPFANSRAFFTLLTLPVCNVSFKLKLQIRENSAYVCMLEDSMGHEIF